MMEFRFMAPRMNEAGHFALMLKRVYAPLIESDPDTWGQERAEWEEFDRQVFQNLETIGSCVFLTRSGDELVGFGSYDPRQRPQFGIIGHNCVLPEFQGQGIGSAQVREIIRRFQFLGIRLARVSTGDQPFFTPARRMYVGCGFREIRRAPWQREPRQNIIEYEKDLS
jgi:GNAT superfamily N-acetyltransferase